MTTNSIKISDNNNNRFIKIVDNKNIYIKFYFTKIVKCFSDLSKLA